MDDPFVGTWERRINEFLTEPVPDRVRKRGEKTVADVLAAAVAGSAVSEIESVVRTVESGSGGASVLGTDRQLQPEQAALYNTTAAIAQEIEEGHNTGGHVGAGIVAGGLALAETAGVDGETYVDACVRAYEICVRLERAIFAMKDRINEAIPWLLRNPHSTWTTVGPALTGAICLGATAEELRETFRIAANLAVVSMHDPYAEGAPSRNFTAGFSAQAGVTAARLGVAGLSGSAASMMAVYDPFEEIVGDFSAEFETLGESWAIEENYFKPYPSCRYTHPPLDALRDAIDGESIDPDAVERIVINTFSNATDMDHAAPTTLTSAKFSTPYVLSRYLHDGSVELESFSDEAIADPSVRRLAERVELRESSTYEAAFPESWGASAEIRLRDGSEQNGECAYPTGDYRNPIPNDRYRDRNRKLLAHALGADRADTALEALETLGTRPIRATTAMLTLPSTS